MGTIKRLSEQPKFNFDHQKSNSNQTIIINFENIQLSSLFRVCGCLFSLDLIDREMHTQTRATRRLSTILIALHFTFLFCMCLNKKTHLDMNHKILYRTKSLGFC